MKTILIFGKHGQVGWELQRSLAHLGQIIVKDSAEANFGHPESLRQIVRECHPHVIVNAAAYTAVDKAEIEKDLAFAINGTAPRVLAEEASRLKALFVHFSTDYVFDGNASKPYLEEDTVNPINVYGESKLQGEQLVQAVGENYIILRTSWVYGLRGQNFLLKMLELAESRPLLKIVNDQIGAPTWSRMIAYATASIILESLDKNKKSGIYHLTSGGETTRYDFAKKIFSVQKTINPNFKVPELEGISSGAYPLPAARPLYSVLCNDKIENEFHIRLPHWEQGLELAMN